MPLKMIHLFSSLSIYKEYDLCHLLAFSKVEQFLIALFRQAPQKIYVWHNNRTGSRLARPWTIYEEKCKKERGNGHINIIRPIKNAKECKLYLDL